MFPPVSRALRYGVQPTYSCVITPESQELIVSTPLHRRSPLEVAERAHKEGFDRILVRPTGGDGMYSIAYVRLRDK